MRRIEVIQGDITRLDVDVVVNAANAGLRGGGGVDGAIHQAGGGEITRACERIIEVRGGCSTGEAVITGSGNLPCRYVIHAVGPVWHGGTQNEKMLLFNAYYNSMRLAGENGARLVAFPNISTGVYAFPKDLAATIAVKAVREFPEMEHLLSRVIFCCFEESNYRIYQKLLS